MRSARPFGNSSLAGSSEYRSKCRGWVSAGSAAPEDHQVRPLRHFAERAGRFAHFLNRHDRRPVADRGRRVDDRPDLIRQAHGRPLPGRAAARKSIDQRSPARLGEWRPPQRSRHRDVVSIPRTRATGGRASFSEYSHGRASSQARSSPMSRSPSNVSVRSSHTHPQTVHATS